MALSYFFLQMLFSDEKQELNPLECIACGKCYSSPWNLQRHLKIHKRQLSSTMTRKCIIANIITNINALIISAKRSRSEVKKKSVAEERDMLITDKEEARYQR